MGQAICYKAFASSGVSRKPTGYNWMGRPPHQKMRKNTFNCCILQKSNRSPTVGKHFLYLSNGGYFFCGVR